MTKIELYKSYVIDSHLYDIVPTVLKQVVGFLDLSELVCMCYQWSSID